MTRLITGLILITTLNCLAQTIHDDISSIYNFSPGKLTEAEQNEKIPSMDGFWNKVKSDTTKYLADLRTELKKEGNPKFFYYEGGQLLLSISKTTRDKKIVLDAIIKSDVGDVDRRNLVATLNYLAQSNLNTTDAALKILDDKHFAFFIPEHSFHFNQGYCLTYALLPTNPAFYLETVTTRFIQEKDVNTQKSIVTLLWFLNSCAGNEFLHAQVAEKKIDKEVAAYIKDLLTRKLKKEKYYQNLDSMSFDDLLEEQKKITNHSSDEAIYELDYVTKLLRKKNCRP